MISFQLRAFLKLWLQGMPAAVEGAPHIAPKVLASEHKKQSETRKYAGKKSNGIQPQMLLPQFLNPNTLDLNGTNAPNHGANSIQSKHHFGVQFQVCMMMGLGMHTQSSKQNSKRLQPSIKEYRPEVIL